MSRQRNPDDFYISLTDLTVTNARFPFNIADRFTSTVGQFLTIFTQCTYIVQKYKTLITSESK